MPDIRREPFRFFFLFGGLLGLLGVLPWLLFGTGLVHSWMGTFHSLTMTEGFLIAVAAGFLGTMIPRRTGTTPMSTTELVLLTVGLGAVPLATCLDRLDVAQLGFLLALGTLVGFAARRLLGREAARPAPPSFVLLPAGVAAGTVGAVLLLWYARGGPAALLPAGRSLVEEGPLLGAVLALAPMLSPSIAHDRAAPDPPPATRRRLLAVHTVAAAAFLASFAIQHLGNERAGLLLRGAVAAVELVFGAGLWRYPTAPGLHRRLYSLALLMVPVGLLCAGARPELRVPFLHLTFVGGLSLLVFAVSMHVTFLHTGREPLARTRPWQAAVVAVLTLAAAAARASAERFPRHYFAALALAAGLWLSATLVWMMFLAPMLLAPRAGGERPSRAGFRSGTSTADP